MPFDEYKNRHNPDNEKEPVFNPDDKINTFQKSGADGVAENTSDPAAEFIIKNNKDHQEIDDIAKIAADGIGYGPLHDLPGAGPIGEASLLPDFEGEEVQETPPVSDLVPQPPRFPGPSRLRPDAKGKKKHKKLPIIVSSALALVVVVSLLWILVFRDIWNARHSDPVNVLSVGLLTGLDADTSPKYSGVVEPQKTESVKKDASKTLKEVYVDIGDQVIVGQPLFAYDTTETALALRQSELDLETINSTITTLKTTLAELNTALNKANSSDKAAYTVQIRATELSIKEQEYNLGKKQLEIEKLKEEIQSAEVTSEFNGIIKELNLSDQVDEQGQAKPFISIQVSSEYRVVGTISEQSIGLAYEGQQVLIRSRVDAEMTWTGIIETIDFENPVENSGNTVYYDSSLTDSNQTTKFNFYIALDSYEELILGQHVYIELVVESNTSQEGLWLPASYIVHEDDGSYVWARDEDELLTEKVLILGMYDSQSDLYQIISGITISDYIAYPSEDCKRGVPTVITEDIYSMGIIDDSSMYEDGAYDEYGGLDDGTYDDGTYNDGTEDGTSDNGTFDGGMFDENSGESSLDNEADGRQMYDAEGNPITIDTNAYGAMPEVL